MTPRNHAEPIRTQGRKIRHELSVLVPCCDNASLWAGVFVCISRLLTPRETIIVKMVTIVAIAGVIAHLSQGRCPALFLRRKNPSDRPSTRFVCDPEPLQR